MNMHLHTHLAETKDEEQFCLQRFGYSGRFRRTARLDRR